MGKCKCPNVNTFLSVKDIFLRDEMYNLGTLNLVFLGKFIIYHCNLQNLLLMG